MAAENAGLLQRVGRMLRPGASERSPRARGPARPQLETLVERLNHLEQVVESLQDSLHRQSMRQDERVDELWRRTQPDEIARALSADSRRRGL